MMDNLVSTQQFKFAKKHRGTTTVQSNFVVLTRQAFW